MEISDKEWAFAVWEGADPKPKTFRQAKALIKPGDISPTEGTLRVYFSQWKRSHGIQRRYKRSEKKDE